MSIPLSFLRSPPIATRNLSLGEHIAGRIAASDAVKTLLDCLCSTSDPAIHSPDPSRPPLRHDELHSFVSNFALPYFTSRRQLERNDRVMLVLPTGPENAVALLCVSTYHTCAPINASCTPNELLEDARRLGVKAVIATKEAESRLDLRYLSAELGCDIIYLTGRSSGPSGLFDMALMETSISTFVTEPFPSQPHGLDDLSLILHTSGTSGKKKVVPYTLRSLIVGTWAVVQSWDLKRTDVNMNMMPLFHVGGIVRNLLAPILSGGSAIMCSGFDAMAFWTLASERKATYYAAPTIHHAILVAKPDAFVASRDLHIRMICNAAGGLLPSLASELKNTFSGATILPSYGMTECMPIASPPTNYQLDRPGCSGIACGPYLSIRDPLDLERELPPGKTGAVSVRGIPTFQGYETVADPSVPLDTSAFSSEGWFDSGDVGYMDNDGYLFITGRSKEIINKGGEVVSPFEVEEAIVTAAKDYVKTALAFSVEHDVLQESIGVVLVPAPGCLPIGLTQLHDLLRDNLHPSKWPFVIVYMNDIPKNSAGKPLRIKLASRLGLGLFADSIPLSQRHFEAHVPAIQADISESIPCCQVSLEDADVEGALKSIPGIIDVAIRIRSDGSQEAFVYVDGVLVLKPSDIQRSLSSLLPGYAIPESVHLCTSPLATGSAGLVNFDALERRVASRNALSMTKRELLVRDIVSRLLRVEASRISSDSDFFLLGGNSLLLGQLSYYVRKEAGVDVGIASLFTNSTINGIASLIDAEEKLALKPESLIEDDYRHSETVSDITLNSDDESIIQPPDAKSRGQTHPFVVLVQGIPVVCFYPMKTALTWSLLLFLLSYLAQFINSNNPVQRLSALSLAILCARLCTRIVAPLCGVAFKWLVIGRYQPGVYKMWSGYHLRWWIVNQALRTAGRGIFAMHPSLELLYYRMLGAQIGNNVVINKKARLGEFDLLTFQDDCRIDVALIRGFCVEREGFFRLGPIVVGRKAVVNTYTTISPGTIVRDGAVFGPHASSYEQPSPEDYSTYNRSFVSSPPWYLRVFVGWPIMLFVIVISYVPWFTTIWLMFDQTQISEAGAKYAIELVIFWFASPKRIAFHALSRIVRATLTPLIRLVLGIAVKRAFGLNRECAASEYSQLMILRRWISSILLSQDALQRAFSILGNHYEVVSMTYRAMGAKIGKNVYWPGTGVYCLDPELMEIGNNVTFGSRSEFFTSDGLGSGRIVVGDGAMIADRVVLLPGTRVGRGTVMGSGALGKRNTLYADGSTWMGNDRGEAICFSTGNKETGADKETITPFGRAFYKREANYFVYPYALILFTNLVVAAISAAYWSISPVAAAQLLRQLQIHLRSLELFRPSWYRLTILYGLIALAFIITLNIQAMIAVTWVIVTKWVVIGRRQRGEYDWDKSSYCQRWQLHLVLSRLLHKGFGNGGILGQLTGSVYLVWYFRALGAKIGKNCAIYAGGRTGLMTEPDLVELGDNVNLDDCSVVAHINSRGNFALNNLKIGDGCAMRSGSRLLSGASMEQNSMLCEHTLLTSGEVAESGTVYIGWPARRLKESPSGTLVRRRNRPIKPKALICPVCGDFPRSSAIAACGHVFCEDCIVGALSDTGKCPVCSRPSSVESHNFNNGH